MLFISFSTYSQVTASVQNLQYTNNGQATISAANCGNLDFGTSTSTSINLGINLSKPNGQVVGLSDLRVYTQKSSSDSRIERSWGQIQESSWNTLVQPNTRQASANFSINSSDFNVSGGILFVVFKSSGGTEYQTTCSFTISKTPLPTFTFSPTSLSLACGDTSSRTFTVTPANIPSGATVTYQWSYSGWSGSATSSMSTVTLTPSSSISLPSNVSVTPFINGIAQTTRTCSITINPFTSPATISGANTICTLDTSTTYTINAGAGNTVNWSSSDLTKAIISTQSNNQATITSVANGTVTLTANIINSCGQNSLKHIIIGIGQPQIDNVTFTNSNGNSDFCINIRGQNIARFAINTSAPNILRYHYRIFRGATIIADDIITNINNLFTGIVEPDGIAGSYTVECRIESSCGWAEWKRYNVFFRRCSTIRSLSDTLQTAGDNIYQAYPNPARDFLRIDLRDQNIQPKSGSKINGELFDMMGKSQSIIQIDNNKASHSIQNLKKGIYVLKIFINDQVESYNISIE